jgi:hypothetical protein
MYQESALGELDFFDQFPELEEYHFIMQNDDSVFTDEESDLPSSSARTRPYKKRERSPSPGRNVAENSHGPTENPFMQRIESVVRFLDEHCPVFTNLQHHDAIEGFGHTHFLIVWLDFPEDTPVEELTRFELSDPEETDERLYFYGLVCSDEAFNFKGKHAFSIVDKEKRQQEGYRWNHIQAVQLFKKSYRKRSKKG